MNEELILAVFKSIAEYKPSLKKYLVTDEPDEEIDIRILGDLVIKNFPWPIGIELRRLFSGSMRHLDRARLDQLFKTFERTLQFTTFVLIAQLWEEKLNGKIVLPPEFTSQFENRLGTLTLGNYSWFIRSISNVFKQNETEHFVIEKNEVFTKKFFELLDFWVPERNDIGHYQINLNENETQKRCVEYEERLKLILEKLAFMTKYRLVTVRQINVMKGKHTTAKFNHHLDLLNSSDSDFKGMEVLQDEFSDSNAVLLMKDIKQPKEYLNLSPLIIDSRTEVIDQKEKFNIKRDIFLYSKFQNGKLTYIGTEVTEKCDLTNLSNYLELVNQYNDLVKTITGV